MDFQPFLSQLIPHSTHKFLLANPLALAALGEPDHRIRKHRPVLKEGVHYLYIPDAQNRPRLYYTVAGLLDLATRIDTERSREFFRALIGQFSNSTSGKLAVSEPATLQPVEVLPSELVPTRLDFPTISPNLAHNPQLAELLQLKREELQLKRNAQELERLKILSNAIQQNKSQPTRQECPDGDASTGDDNSQKYTVDGQKHPLQINIQNNLKGSSGETADIEWMQSFALWLLSLVVIMGLSMLCLGAVVFISNQMERSSHVR